VEGEVTLVLHNATAYKKIPMSIEKPETDIRKQSGISISNKDKRG
jgi:hypothetical protein